MDQKNSDFQCDGDGNDSGTLVVMLVMGVVLVGVVKVVVGISLLSGPTMGGTIISVQKDHWKNNK